MRCRGGRLHTCSHSTSWVSSRSVSSDVPCVRNAVDRTFVEGTAASPRDRRRHDRAPDVGLGPRRVSQPRPRHVGLDQCLLEQVLCQMVVADHNVGRTEQRVDRAATNSAKAETSPCASNRHGCSSGRLTILYLLDASETHKGCIATTSTIRPTSGTLQHAYVRAALRVQGGCARPGLAADSEARRCHTAVTRESIISMIRRWMSSTGPRPTDVCLPTLDNFTDDQPTLRAFARPGPVGRCSGIWRCPSSVAWARS